MAVTTRTNRATNPAAASTTNWAAVAGTGGGASLSNQSSGGAYGTTFNRVTWSTATTAVGGGFTYLQTGLSANTAYSIQVWVRSSKAQTVNLTAAFQASGGSTINTVVSASATLVANTWTQLTVTGTSGAAVAQVNLVVGAAAGGSNWAVNDTLDGDAACIETGSTVGPYFDGSFTAGGSIVYAWTGTANASTSTATTYLPALAVAGKTDAPCPRAEVTITDLAPGASTVNVWRTADGKRSAVRGWRRHSINGSDFVTDYEVPGGRSVAYDLEILDGLSAQAVVTTQTVNITFPNGNWYIQDPLVPSSAIALAVNKAAGAAAGIPSLTAAAVKALEYAAGVNIIPVQGAEEPVAIVGQRTLAGNVDFSMYTNTAQATTNLRNLLKEAPLLLIRPPGIRNDGLPGLCYVPAAKPVEQPITVAYGGTLTKWAFTSDLVAAPTVNIVVPIWTYGNVAALWATYQQAQTAFAGKTYLDALKSPTGV